MNCRKFPKFPYTGGKFSKVGNYCGNLSLPSGNLLVCDLVTLSSPHFATNPQSELPKTAKMSGINAPLAFLALLALAVLLPSPPGAESRSSGGLGDSVGQMISSMEHTLAVLEGRDLEMEDQGGNQMERILA